MPPFVQSVVAAPDDTTLVFNHFGGTITLTFQDAAHLNQVAAAILDATSTSTDAPDPVSAVRPVVDGGVEEAADINDSEEADSDSENEAENEAEKPSEAASSGSETEEEKPKSPESSFESYDGYGLTQELDF